MKLNYCHFWELHLYMWEKLITLKARIYSILPVHLGYLSILVRIVSFVLFVFSFLQHSFLHFENPFCPDFQTLCPCQNRWRKQYVWGMCAEHHHHHVVVDVNEKDFQSVGAANWLFLWKYSWPVTFLVSQTHVTTSQWDFLKCSLSFRRLWPNPSGKNNAREIEI